MLELHKLEIIWISLFKGIVWEKYDAVPIKTDKRSSLASLLSQFPFGREIIPVSDPVYVHTSSPIIYQNTISHCADMQVSNLGFS
jgi:hypothetical protein